MSFEKNASLLLSDAYVGGTWVSSPSRFAVHNPADGTVITQVSDGGAELAIAAIHAAKNAFDAWRGQTAGERSRLLRHWFELIMQNQDELARIMTLEQGKPLSEAKGEVAYGASFVEWFAEEAKRVYGETVPSPGSDKRILVSKQPVGVVTAITPWNFPSSMITRKAAPALAAGCTFVLRPASQTPLSALALAYLADLAGFPPGVFNVVTSLNANEVGKVFTEHPLVAKFSFTGSTAVGKKLIAQCASTVKRVSMERGGNAPFIVFDDADLDAAVRGAIASKYRIAGQTCVCAKRGCRQTGVMDAFVSKLAQAVSQLKVGKGLDKGVEVGPLITAKAMQAVDNLVQTSIAQGSVLVLGGKPHPLGGSFYSPTILKNVTNDMPIAIEEIFGPVAPLIPFTTEEEVVQLANDTPFGLAAYFYTRDIGRRWRGSEGLEYGMVGINEGIISNAAAPFGGMKESGLGREGSRHGMDEYLEMKYLCVGGIDS